MYATRRAFAVTAPRIALRSAFHSSARSFVQVGDALPNVELMENSPGNKVNLSQELKGKGVVIGVPAAFSRLFLSEIEVGEHLS